MGPSCTRNPLERLPGSWNSGLAIGTVCPGTGVVAKEAPKSPKKWSCTGGASGSVKSNTVPVLEFPPARMAPIWMGCAVETVCDPRPSVMAASATTPL